MGLIKITKYFYKKLARVILAYCSKILNVSNVTLQKYLTWYLEFSTVWLHFTTLTAFLHCPHRSHKNTWVLVPLDQVQISHPLVSGSVISSAWAFECVSSLSFYTFKPLRVLQGLNLMSPIAPCFP